MKRLLLSLSFTIVSIAAYSQNCTPSWPAGGGPGIMPDSATNLPTAHETQAYSAVVQFKVPLDTTADVGGLPVPVTVQDITVNSVTGLSDIPATTPFTYITNPVSGVFPGDSIGCVLITGTPALGSSGVYPILVAVTAHATVNGLGFQVTQNDTVDYYHIVVDNNLSATMIDGRENGLVAYPAVTAANCDLMYFTSVSSHAVIRVVNALGQNVMTLRENANAGSNKTTLNLGSLADGCYVVTLQTSNAMHSTKVMVSK